MTVTCLLFCLIYLFFSVTRFLCLIDMRLLIKSYVFFLSSNNTFYLSYFISYVLTFLFCALLCLIRWHFACFSLCPCFIGCDLPVCLLCYCLWSNCMFYWVLSGCFFSCSIEIVFYSFLLLSLFGCVSFSLICPSWLGFHCFSLSSQVVFQ